MTPGPRQVPDAGLPEILLGLAEGRSLDQVARSTGKTKREVVSALESLAQSLGAKAPGGGLPFRATLHCDGAARGNPGHAGVGWVISSGGETLIEGGRYIGTATNNVAEYTAALDALDKALELGVREVELKLDSELVVRQLNGVYRVKDAKLLDCHRQLQSRIHRLESFTASHVRRKENHRADELANRAIDEALASEGNRSGSR